MKHLGRYFLLIAATLLVSNVCFGNVYKCAKMVYSQGWLTKYDVKGNTWGANTKKHGTTGSTVGYSSETSTASIDPGVTTGHSLSSAQYSSSWGDCNILEMEIASEVRKQYIAQNMMEIKKQVAMGSGHHLDSLAYLSGCQGISAEIWRQNLQRETVSIYDSASAEQIVEVLKAITKRDHHLVERCPAMT